MKYEQIAALLEKYWEGETSLEEERQLKAYFSSGAIDERLLRVAPLFRVLHQDRAVQFAGALPQRRVLTLSAGRSWAMAAAVVGLLLVGWLGWSTWSDRSLHPVATLANNPPPAMTEDTYDDPEKAAAEIKAALALVSSKLNKGKKAAAKGLKKMETVDKYLIVPGNSPHN